MFLKDRSQITTERKYTDEGFLIVPARISRTGIQLYTASEMGLNDKDPKDIIKVYRPEEEVFSEISLVSFSNKPITNNHPPELVNASNVKKYSVGHSGPEVYRDGDYVKTELHVMDEQSISDIENGKSELSNGYIADIDWTPGVTPDGEQYDAIQRNIKGNHIAIVERGRAGPSCKVADNSPKEGDDTIMAKITVDGVDFEVSDQAAQAVAKLQKRLSDADEETKKKEEELKAKEDEAEEMEKKAKETEDSLKTQLDEANSKVLSATELDKLVADRADLIEKVKVISPDISWEGKDNLTIKKEVVAEKFANVQMDSVSEDYISARFDTLVESIASDSLTNVIKESFTKDKEVTDSRPAHVIAREKMMEDSRNAWKRGDK